MCKHLAFNGDHHNHGKSKGIYKSLLCAFYISLECWFFFHSHLLISWMFLREREREKGRKKQPSIKCNRRANFYSLFVLYSVKHIIWILFVCVCVFVHKLSMIIEYECWSQTIKLFARSSAATWDFFKIHLLDVFQWNSFILFWGNRIWKCVNSSFFQSFSDSILLHRIEESFCSDSHWFSHNFWKLSTSWCIETHRHTVYIILRIFDFDPCFFEHLNSSYTWEFSVASGL